MSRCGRIYVYVHNCNYTILKCMMYISLKQCELYALFLKWRTLTVMMSAVDLLTEPMNAPLFVAIAL